MNAKTKKRLVVVTAVIALVLVVVLAFVASFSAAKTISLDEALSGSYQEQRVQVSGNVVANSFTITDKVLTFAIYDPEGSPARQLLVSFAGSAAATFGNEVTALCTGVIDVDGVLQASVMITKCPSKYESATGALSISELLAYGEAVYDKPVKVTGSVQAGTLKPAGYEARFVLLDADIATELSVQFDGALPDAIQDGSVLVLTGSLGSGLRFVATDVALEG